MCCGWWYAVFRLLSLLWQIWFLRVRRLPSYSALLLHVIKVEMQTRLSALRSQATTKRKAKPCRYYASRAALQKGCQQHVAAAYCLFAETIFMYFLGCVGSGICGRVCVIVGVRLESWVCARRRMKQQLSSRRWSRCDAFYPLIWLSKIGDTTTRLQVSTLDSTAAVAAL